MDDMRKQDYGIAQIGDSRSLVLLTELLSQWLGKKGG